MCFCVSLLRILDRHEKLEPQRYISCGSHFLCLFLSQNAGRAVRDSVPRGRMSHTAYSVAIQPGARRGEGRLTRRYERVLVREQRAGAGAGQRKTGMTEGENSVKIVYIGAADVLAEALIERLGKEGNDAYLLSDQELPGKKEGGFKYRFYRNIRNSGALGKILGSISPDYVIFAGNHYINGAYCEEEEEDVTQFASVLRVLPEIPGAKLALLSSIEVYGAVKTPADENCERRPVTQRGLRFVREELLFELYRRQYGVEGVILRGSQLYSDRVKEGNQDFLSAAFTQADRLPEGDCVSDEVLQPLHVSDFVDALNRAINGGQQDVYNVCGSFQVWKRQLYLWIGQALGRSEKSVIWREAQHLTLGDNRRIKSEQEWTDFRSLEDQLAGGKIAYERLPVEKKRREKSNLPAGVRRTVENLAVFAAFFGLNVLCQSHSLFSQIDWLLMYVILISLFLGIRQSSLAVILASCTYLFSQDLTILEMNNFYSYAGSVLVIMEFVFLGLVVSYTADMLRENLRNNALELDMLRAEHEDLKAINDENVLIKNEYEERLLDSRYGLPKLYHMVSRLMVLEPDRIFMEIMSIISELVHTDTVAVYRVRAGSPYLRLINALNEESIAGGKSWDVSPYPQIVKCMERGELYQGAFGSEEPAVTLPILHQGACVAVILIQKLPYESETLYHINLLKTLSLLLRDSVGRALDYEELTRSEQYLEGVDVLKPEPFRKTVRLAMEKSEKRIAEYCLLEIPYSGSLEAAYGAVAPKLRVTDHFGVDETGRLYALLNSTGAGDLERLQERLAADGVELRAAEPFAALAEV